MSHTPPVDSRGAGMYLYQPGFSEDSVIYEIKLKEVARLKHATIDEVSGKMDELGVRQVVLDAAYPTIIERIKLRRQVKKLIRRPPPERQTNE